jgi:threonyl-tRNA synthetase
MFRRQALGLRIIKPHLRTILPGRRWCTTSTRSSPEAEKAKIERLLAMELPTNDGSPNLLKIRHTASHVLAMAVQNLYPTVKVTIGPWIESGFV